MRAKKSAAIMRKNFPNKFDFSGGGKAEEKNKGKGASQKEWYQKNDPEKNSQPSKPGRGSSILCQEKAGRPVRGKVREKRSKGGGGSAKQKDKKQKQKKKKKCAGAPVPLGKE